MHQDIFVAFLFLFLLLGVTPGQCKNAGVQEDAGVQENAGVQTPHGRDEGVKNGVVSSGSSVKSLVSRSPMVFIGRSVEGGADEASLRGHGLRGHSKKRKRRRQMRRQMMRRKVVHRNTKVAQGEFF